MSAFVLIIIAFGLGNGSGAAIEKIEGFRTAKQCDAAAKILNARAYAYCIEVPK